MIVIVFFGEVESAASSMDSDLEAFNHKFGDLEVFSHNFFDLEAFNSPKASKNSKSQKTSEF